MTVYDQNGKPLDNFDLNRGYLKKKNTIIHHEAVASVEERGHWETLHEYSTGGKDVEWVIDVPGVKAKDAWDESVTITVYIPYTEEELAEQEQKKRVLEEKEARKKAIEEVQNAIITAQINTLSVDDDTAFRWKMLYPEWKKDIFYKKDTKVQHDKRLYKCLQEHTSQIGWEPVNAPALWTEIVEAHSGTIDDPIPYNNNMELEEGKYYIQNDVKYHCIRDTGIPVYNPLRDLIGLYVEVV